MTRILILLACLLAAGCADRSAWMTPLSAETPTPAATSGTGWTP
jgi:hypothetical protein